MASLLKENLTFNQAHIVVESAGEGKAFAFAYKWTHAPSVKWYIGSRTAPGCHPDARHENTAVSSETLRLWCKAKMNGWSFKPNMKENC